MEEQKASKSDQEYELDDQGYEDLSYEDANDQSGDDGDFGNYGVTQKDVDIPNELTGLRTEIEEKIRQLNLTSYFMEGDTKKVTLMGDGNAIQDFIVYLDSLKKLMTKNSFVGLSLGPHIQKEIPMRTSFKHFRPLIDNISEKLELVVEYEKTKLVVHGYERRVKDLMAFLFEKEAEYGQGQYIDQDVSISTFLRVKKDQIQIKADQLGLKFEFGYDKISVRGQRKLVDHFVLYMMDLESKAKQALFPKYWDFTDSKPLSLVQISEKTEEYKLVELPFMKGIPNAKIISIQRVQNKYLMDQFVMVINKIMEERPNEQINRRLLFHGTRENPPEKIYANFDTGFDLQYARYGMYGKGLYFADNSTYSNGYAYHGKDGIKKMFIADVFLGKPYPMGGNHAQVKAPAGYDSIEAKGSGFYIVYHNFYSYPLYLIEYK